MDCNDEDDCTTVEMSDERLCETEERESEEDNEEREEGRA